MASEGHRFSPISTNDHAGSIWIATLLCLVYTGIVFLTRAFLRRKMYGTDDYLILGATLLHLAEAAAVMVGLNHGLGKTISLLRDDSAATASKATYAAQILYIASSCLAKCSTMWLMMRLFNLNGTKGKNGANSKLYFIICAAIMGIVGLWGIGSIIGLSANCSASNFIRSPSRSLCPQPYVRWEVVTALDIATEAALVMIATVIVAPVQLAPYMKFQVVLAFLFRLPLVALAYLRLHYVKEYTNSADAGIAQEPIMVIQQTYLCWSIISATIPNLKAFVRSFGSGFGIGLDMEGYTQAYGSKGSYGKQYEMGSVKNAVISNGSRNNRSYNDIEHQDDIVAARQRPRTSTHPESGSIESAGSQERIIRKDVQWRVEYENSRF